MVSRAIGSGLAIHPESFHTRCPASTGPDDVTWIAAGPRFAPPPRHRPKIALRSSQRVPFTPLRKDPIWPILRVDKADRADSPDRVVRAVRAVRADAADRLARADRAARE